MAIDCHERFHDKGEMCIRDRNRHRGPCDRREKGFRHPAAVGHSDHGGRYDAVDSPHRAVADVYKRQEYERIKGGRTIKTLKFCPFFMGLVLKKD